MTTPHSTTGNQDDNNIINPYADEAKQRWGDTEAYKQSQERVAKLSTEEMKKIHAAGEALMRKIASAAEAGKDPADPTVQELIAQHYDGLRTFYEPNLQLYRGLADMYVADERFGAYYDKFRLGLAIFLRDAMHAYCNAQNA